MRRIMPVSLPATAAGGVPRLIGSRQPRGPQASRVRGGIAPVAGKRVLVTGAAGGFGAATYALLKRLDARVVGLDVVGGESVDVTCDVSDRDAVSAAVATAAERLGGLDVLVNNAGIGTASPVGHGFGFEERQVVEVNLGGAWHVTAAALPHLLRTGGQVINVASLLAVVNTPYTGAYSASKRGLCALSGTLRLEHGDRLAVTTVYPGYVATGIHGPAEERAGVTLADISREESVDDAARTIARAIERRPRHAANTWRGEVVLRAAMAVPWLVDAVVRRRACRAGILPVPEAELPGGSQQEAAPVR